MSSEIPVTFEIDGSQLFGVVHLPDASTARGLVVVTGGPTYRVGPHRMNVMLGRELAGAGVPVMRFDFRGTGDSGGDLRTYKRGEQVMQDIRGAIDMLFKQVPDLDNVVLWGLCRGAIRTLEYAYRDSRVSGVVLLNPRVDNDQVGAVASLKHYYWGRLTNPDFYRKVISGKIDAVQSMKQVSETVLTALRPQRRRDAKTRQDAGSTSAKPDYVPVETLIEEGFDRFRGRFMVVLGGADLESSKFKEIIKRSARLQRRLSDPGIDIRNLAGATHTFSSRDAMDTVIDWTRDWVSSF